MAKRVNSSRSSLTNGAYTVWSLTEPCTNTSGGPSPSTQTAIDPPSPDLTSHRSATSPILRCHHHKLPVDQPTTDPDRWREARSSATTPSPVLSRIRALRLVGRIPL